MNDGVPIKALELIPKVGCHICVCFVTLRVDHDIILFFSLFYVSFMVLIFRSFVLKLL